MEKRAILAIVLSLLVVVVWSILFAPPPPSVETPPVEQEAQEVRQSPLEASDRLTRQTSPTEVHEPRLRPGSTEMTLVTVDTGVAQLVISSQGGGIKTVRLLDYPTSLDEGSPPTEITPVPDATTIPLTVELQLDSRTVSLASVNFVPSATTLTLSEAEPEGRIILSGQIDAGGVVERAYHFRYGSYVFEISTRVNGFPLSAHSAMHLSWGPGLRQEHEQATRRRQTGTRQRSYISSKIFHEAPEEVGGRLEKQGEVTWAALADTYFTAVLIPQQPVANAVVVRRLAVGPSHQGSEDKPQSALEIALQTPLGESQTAQTVRVYVGPKQRQLLKAAEPTLGKKLIDLGWVDALGLATGMMQLLRFIYSLVQNYGVAIIVVTFLTKIVFWPLTQKSYKSMQAMQKLQPKMKELQAVYKDDKQALNRATMQLYRDNKVNPMGGCLPMLLQIPFFFAFYNALLYSIELRHAPFICWQTELFWIGRGICDLSVHDPSYITPVLMGVSMLVQQRMTPTTGDPTQAKMMQFMPLIFLFFFLKAPAGLVVYWLVNNLLSIAQQLLINRTRHQETAQAEATSKG